MILCFVCSRPSWRLPCGRWACLRCSNHVGLPQHVSYAVLHQHLAALAQSAPAMLKDVRVHSFSLGSVPPLITALRITPALGDSDGDHYIGERRVLLAPLGRHGISLAADALLVLLC